MCSLEKEEIAAYGVDHASKAITALGDDVDDGSTMLTHVALIGCLAEVKCPHEV